MTIYADIREIPSGIPDILEKRGNKVSKKKLTTGDYLMRNDQKLVVCIERKTAQDYVDSLIDGRLNNQQYKMSKLFTWYIIAVEGSPLEYINHGVIPMNTVASSLAGGILKRAPTGKQGTCSIVPTLSIEGTAALIHYLHKKLKGNELTRLPKMPKLAFNDNERVVTMLTLIPAVGEKKAKQLLHAFGSPQGVFNATYGELIKLNRIGDTIAKNIQRIYTVNYDET